MVAGFTVGVCEESDKALVGEGHSQAKGWWIESREAGVWIAPCPPVGLSHGHT